MRCRVCGSLLRCFWLARSISGSNQQVSVRRGEDNGSTAKYKLEKSQPISRFHLSQ